MNLTTQELATFCDGMAVQGNHYMAAVACVALGTSYEWWHLPLSPEQMKSVRSLDSEAATTIVDDYVWEMTG